MQVLTIVISFFIAGATCFVHSFLWHRRMRGGLETETIMRGLQTEISELITELNGTTDRNIALLENRVRTLNELVEKASKIEKVLSIEEGKKENADRVYSELGRNKPMSIQEDIPEPATSIQEDIPEPATVEIDFDSLSIRDKVLVQHRSGYPIDSIIDECGMSRGEVELIIALHDREYSG